MWTVPTWSKQSRRAAACASCLPRITARVLVCASPILLSWSTPRLDWHSEACQSPACATALAGRVTYNLSGHPLNCHAQDRRYQQTQDRLAQWKDKVGGLLAVQWLHAAWDSYVRYCVTADARPLQLLL